MIFAASSVEIFSAQGGAKRLRSAIAGLNSGEDVDARPLPDLNAVDVMKSALNWPVARL